MKPCLFYLRSDLVCGYVNAAEVEMLHFDAIDLALGNDVAGRNVIPDGFEQPLDSPEFSQVEEEYPEGFTVCCHPHSEQT